MCSEAELMGEVYPDIGPGSKIAANAKELAGKRESLMEYERQYSNGAEIL